MPITYTKINKPTIPTYTNVNSQGREQYDQADVMYDDPNVFYDGVNQTFYSNVAKPVTTTYTKVLKPT